MSSSTPIGDRRWASSRKGMTVLGKVPKPINLPSQKLENHGVDPNVEIVPKGTLTWGSRSSTTPNAWGSPSHSSPSAEGSIGSPCHHNGRPSSGGSGTRPSTAGSDRCSEPATSAWASSSRPSSASGILTLNQAPLASTRPRSAETRPGSSQLSRFAESIPENSVPWGSASAAGHKGPTTKTSNFTLSSGDFPTLGSAKNSELHGQQASHSSHGNPPTSGTTATEKEMLNSSKEVPGVKLEKVDSNAWKVDAPPCSAVSPLSSSDSWNVDHQPNQPPPSTNLQSYHLGWHGPPPTTPDGVWYGGVPAPGPYGPGVGPPGSYLPDPFAYYPSQIAARPNVNSSCSSIPGALISGYPQKKTGESFHPQMTSDSYVVPNIPVIPIRPGIYPGPVPYDSYYGPQHAAFSNTSEKERTIIGVSAGPGIYNRSQNQNAIRDLGTFSSRPSAPMQVANEPAERFHSYDSHGEKFRVLLKNRDGIDGIGARNDKGQLSATSLQSSSNKEMDSWDEELETGTKSAEPIKTAQGGLCSSSPFASSVDLPGISKAEADGVSCLNKGDAVMPASDGKHAIKKSALMEKIEGLNNKARADGRNEAFASSREGRPKKVQAENSRADNSAKGTRSPSVSVTKTPSADAPTGARPILNDDQENWGKQPPGYAGEVKSLSQQSGTTIVNGPDNAETESTIQSAVHIRNASLGRSGHHSKTKSNVCDGRRIHTSGGDSSSKNVSSKAANGSEVGIQDDFVVVDNPSKHGLPYVNKVREKTSPVDSAEYSAQRAKIKEIEVEQAKQPLKEEEERNREQKSKAFARLEELNRCASEDVPVQKVDRDSPQNKIPLSEQDPPIINVKKTDAIYVSSEHASGPIPKIDESICTGGGMPVQKNDIYSGKCAEPIVHRRVSCRMPEDANASQKVNFPVNRLYTQISFGTVQPCDVGVNKGGSLPVANTCGSSTGKPKEVTDNFDIGARTCQSASGKSVLQKPSSAGEVGTQKLDDSLSDKFAKQRHVEKRRNNVPHEKNVVEVSDDSAGALLDVAGPQASGDPATKIAYTGGGLVQDLIEPSGPPLQHKKKSNRSNRARVRSEHSTSISTSASPVPSEGILEKPPEVCKLDTTIQHIVSSPSLPIEEKIECQGSKEETVPASSGGSQSAEEGHTKMTGRWKPHPPRKSTRNMHAKSDKFRVSESVVWAPIRSSSNKGDLGDGVEASKNQDPDSAGGTDSQINSKFKRAEMERYAPKFVAKDTSQQGNLQKIPYVNTPAETTSKEFGHNKSNSSNDDAQFPTLLKSEVAAELISQDTIRTSKHGRAHTSWRQRSPQEGSLDSLKTVSNPSHDELPQKTGISPSRSASHLGNEWNDSNNTVSLPPKEPITPVNNDHEVVNRSKRQSQRMYKSVEANSAETDAKFTQSGAADKLKVHNSSVGSDALDGKSLLRNEKSTQVERTRSHWKPKTNQPSMSPSQHQVNSAGDASQSSVAVKEPLVHDGCDINVNDAASEHTRQQGKLSHKAGNFHQYEVRKEKNPMSVSQEDHSNLSGEDPSILSGHDQWKDDPRYAHPARGMHRQGQHKVQFRKGHESAYGGRYSRGQEANYGGRNSGQDGYQNLPASVDRQRHGSHYEYQKIEPQGKSIGHCQRNDQMGDNMDYGNPRAAGPRYRERHFDPRPGGHCYARSGGTYAQGGEGQ